MPEEIQPTAPDIPVKNKASVLASERKFRDTEVNKILAAFQKVDQNFTALLEEILNISLTPGPEGKNAYEFAVLNGFVGSPTDWLQSLIGAPGAPAILTRTSTTSLAIGTGTKTFTYSSASNLGWVVGMRLRATSGANFMEGVIDSVSSTVVDLIVDLIGGSGTHASWNIGVAGAKGSDGSPDTATQIRDKITSLTGEDRLAVAILKDFVTEVLGQIQTEVPGRSSQISVESGVAYIDTLFLNNSTFTVNLKRGAIHGSPQLPIYWRLLIDLTDAKVGNQVTVHHCWIELPDAFRRIWETPTAIYANQADMIAAQGSQTIDLVYKSGATQYWRYLGTTDGDIGDYEPVPHIVFAGNAYLAGVDNLNVLTMDFVSLHEVSGHLIPNCLIVTNKAFTNGNLHTSKPVLDRIVDLNFNENKDLVADPTLLNSNPFFASEASVIVTNPSDATWNDYGGGNYSLQTANNSSSGSRSAVFIELTSALKKSMENINKITVICKIRRRSSLSNTTNMVIAGNFDSVNLKGWQFIITNVNSTPRYTFKAADGTRHAGSSPATFTPVANDNPFWCAAVFDGNDVKFYQKSAERGQAFQEMTYGTNNLTGKKIAGGFDQIRLAGENNTSTPERGRDTDDLKIFIAVLTSAQVDALMTP